MKKGIPRILLVVFIMTILFTACSQNGQVTKEQTGEQKPQEDKTTEPKPVTLSITWWGSQTRHDYTDELLKMYSQKYPHITFESTPSGWDGYFDKMAAQAAGNTMPDIVQMDNLYIATYTKNNAITDLYPFVSNKTLDLSDVPDSIVKTGEINGKLTGAVLSTTALTVPYNPDVFAEAGVSEPTSDWTWADFEQAMLTIKEKTGKYGYASDVLTDTNLLNYWVRQHGVPLYSEDGTKLGYEDDQIFIDYLNMLYRLTKSGSMPTADEWLQIATAGKEARPVVTGDAGAMFEWANFGVIVESVNPNLKLVTPPYTENGTKALWIKPGMFFSVAESSKNKEEAANFISWFINDIEANKVINTERGIPVAAKVKEALKPQLTKQQAAMFDYLDLAVKHAGPISPPEPAGNAEVTKAMADQINLVLYDRTTPEQAAADFRRIANEILARNVAN
jgi:multiple sugar transport system substrate-binding protein